MMAEAYRGKTLIGGPGTMQPSQCEYVEPILFHNPFATFTSRGCPNKCKFCAVPILEGDFTELESWRVAPIICDNNLLASSKRHFMKVIDSLKNFPFVDFNQGLDARLFNLDHVRMLASLKSPKIRFAFDHINMEAIVHDAVKLCVDHGLRDIHVYVLIGFNDDPESARHRLDTVRSWGIRPNPMRYNPLNAVKKNEYVAEGWTEEQLRKFVKYYSRLRWYEHISFGDFEYLERDYRQQVLI